MKTVISGIVILVGVLALTMGLGWFAAGNDFFMFKYFAPKEEAVRREVFEQSKAYNQGMIQELQNMQFEYLKSDKSDKLHRQGLADIILRRAADFDESKLPFDLRSFIDELKRERIENN